MHNDKNGEELRETFKNMSSGEIIFADFVTLNILVGLLGILFDISDIVFCIYKGEAVLIIIYLIINHYRMKEKKRLDAIKKEKEIYERELLNVLRARIDELMQHKIMGSNYFQKFVDTIFKKFTNDYGEWPEPRQYELSDKILEPFQLILEDEYKEEIPVNNIRTCVENRLETIKQQLFNDSFDSLINTCEQYSDDTFLDNAVSLYCDVFGEDDSFFCELEKYMKLKITKENSDTNLLYYLRHTLDGEIDRRKKTKKIETIKHKLDAGIEIFDAVTIFDIDALDGLEFEKIVAALYENMGYKSNVTKGSGDQGGDVVVEKYGVRTVIQAKRYGSSVGNKAVQEVIASKAYYDCEEAVVITNNYFTNAAKALAEANKVQLIDRDELASLLKKYKIVL